MPNERRERLCRIPSVSAPQWSDKFSPGTKKAFRPSVRPSVGRRWLNCDEVDVEKLSYVAASEAIFGFPAARGGRGGELRLV